ncbi:MAG TPA: ribosome biogenesis GTPase YlqF [Gammaproteobacteria bacterium]|nr:ribosome biogenesis GTPase YlqF [Gammaproteobacteria bacterium]
MHIQWYPGHMHKASKEIREALPKVDLIIEILDARIPFSSENPALASLRGNKPCIKILSKTDLADAGMTALWQTWLEQEQGIKTLGITTENPEKIRQIPDLCRKIIPERKNSINKLNVMIMGIPNVGKSTLINILTDKNIAKTGNEPAITKAQQRIKLDNNLILLDTPGVLWPKIENPDSSLRLAATGAIKDTAMDYTDVAFFTGNYLLHAYPELLKERYHLESLPTTELALLEEIGKNRGCLGSGGHIELDKVSKILINEFRTGMIGQISLETPEMIERELGELMTAQTLKAERKAARKRKWRDSQKK